MKLTKTVQTSRRDLLKLPLAAGAAALVPRSAGATATPRKNEYDPDNPKIAVKTDLHSATDDELLFLKQIGLRWVHMAFGEDAPYDLIRNTQERLARYGLKIHSAILDTYRSPRIQLGQPGRDEDIEKFQTFLRDLGRAGVFSAEIDFHPANTYTTQMIESPRGYQVREFSVDDFRAEGRETTIRPPVFGRRHLGQLHLFHQGGSAGGREGQRSPRPASG